MCQFEKHAHKNKKTRSVVKIYTTLEYFCLRSKRLLLQYPHAKKIYDGRESCTVNHSASGIQAYRQTPTTSTHQSCNDHVQKLPSQVDEFFRSHLVTTRMVLGRVTYDPVTCNTTLYIAPGQPGTVYNNYNQLCEIVFWCTKNKKLLSDNCKMKFWEMLAIYLQH